jgi:hypothetical protein
MDYLDSDSDSPLTPSGDALAPPPPGSTPIAKPQATPVAAPPAKTQSAIPPPPPGSTPIARTSTAAPATAKSAAIPPPPPGSTPIAPKGGVSGGIERQAKKLTGADRDPDVDYATGAPWNVQLALARSDNPDQARAMLERRVGKDNVGQDKAGTWWIKIDGKKVAVRPSLPSPGPPPAQPLSGVKGLIDAVSGRDLYNDVERLRHENPAIGNTMTDFAATSPVMAGAVGGAMMGAPFGGPFGAMVGAGLGAMAGKGADTAEKAFEGTLRGSPADVAKDIAKEGMFNASLQGGGTLAGSGLKFAGDWLKTHMFGITPEIAARTRWLLSNGATPPIQIVAPGAKAAAVDQQLRNILAGDPKESANVAYLIKSARAIVASGDVPPEVVEQSMRQLLSQTSAIGGTDVGKSLQEAAQAHYGALRAEMETARNAATKYLANMQQGLREHADAWTGRLGEDVEKAITDKRQEFSDLFKGAYAALDQAAGNERVVPIGRFRNMARAMKLMTPPNQLQPLIGELAESDPNLKLTFSEWHNLRTMLRLSARDKMTNLTPNARAHNALQAAKAAHDYAYNPPEEIADQMDQTDLFGEIEHSGVPKEVLDDLKQTDALYKQGIAKFHNQTLNQLVKDAKDGSFVDPNYVSRAIVAPGHTEQTRMIMSLLPQDTRDQIARADLHNLIVSTSDPNTGMINGKILRGILADPSRKRVMKEVYDPEVLRKTTQMADELAALNGDVDIRSLKDFSGPGIQRAIQMAIDRQQQIKEFVKNGVLNHLADAKAEIVDAAADAILSGRKEYNLERVRDFLGEDSVAWFNLRQYAKKKVLFNAVVERPNQEKTVAGQAIEDVMAKLTEREQNLLFPNGEKEDLQMIAADAKSLFPRVGTDFGTSLAARGIQLRIPFHIRADLKWGESKFVGYLTQHPALLHWLADSERARPGSFKILAGPIMRWAANAETSGPGQGSPTQPSGPSAQPTSGGPTQPATGGAAGLYDAPYGKGL